MLIAGAAWQIAVNVLLTPATLFGAWRVLRGSNVVGYLILFLLLFFMAVNAVSGIDAYTRFSAPFLPFAAVLASNLAACQRPATRS